MVTQELRDKASKAVDSIIAELNDDMYKFHTCKNSNDTVLTYGILIKCIGEDNMILLDENSSHGYDESDSITSYIIDGDMESGFNKKDGIISAFDDFRKKWVTFKADRIPPTTENPYGAYTYQLIWGDLVDNEYISDEDMKDDIKSMCMRTLKNCDRLVEEILSGDAFCSLCEFTKQQREIVANCVRNLTKWFIDIWYSVTDYTVDDVKDDNIRNEIEKVDDDITTLTKEIASIENKILRLRTKRAELKSMLSTEK